MARQIVGGGKFVLDGTQAQNDILLPLFTPGSPSHIAFPWERLRARIRYPIPIRWRDLNPRSARGRRHRVANAATPGPLHPHFVQGRLEGHAIMRPSSWFGATKGRLWTAGVFWTDGRIALDVRLAHRPAEARETLSAEIAHAVDYGLPMTAGHRTALMRLVHRGATDDHTWWEREDYDEEYYTLVGEAWMAMFTHAYSRIEPWQDGFKHKSSRAIAPAVHRILEIAPAGVKASPVRLKARTWRTGFGNAYAELTWTGAQGKRVSVWRGGARLGAAQNDGRFVDFLGGRRGAFSYLVLDAKGQLSNEKTVKV